MDATTEREVDATGTERTNVALANFLARAGWTPENLGDRLNQVSAAQGLGVRGHRRSVRRWVHAEPGRSVPRVPREPWPSLVCHVLHERLGVPVTPEMLGWHTPLGLLYVPADHSLKLLAESALSQERHLSPAVAALIHSRLAFACARVGEEKAWRRSQQRAESLLARSVRSDEPAWVYWFTEAELEGVAGTALLEFGKPEEAEPHLRRAVALIDPAFARDCAMWMSDLAAARVGAGSVEHACATASEAATLMRRLESPRDQRRLARFRIAAAPYEKSSAVREFDAKYHDLIASVRTPINPMKGW